MNENLQIALIAGLVSLLVSTIGLITSLLISKSQSRQAEKRIRSELTEKLVSLRIEHYPNAFNITEKIQRRKDPKGIISRQELMKINAELREWKNGTVSLIISRKSLNAYYELLSVLGMGYGEKDRYTREQVEKIFEARDEFRGALRQDVGFFHAGAPLLE